MLPLLEKAVLHLNEWKRGILFHLGMEDSSLCLRQIFRTKDACISSVVIRESNPASFSDINHPEKVLHVGLMDIMNTTVVFMMHVSPSLKIAMKRALQLSSSVHVN